ncbi:putative nudix hydrolase 7 [Smittium mucronatum]|uniref:Putative nudix hydrolase 7 n=1 Tax=Smittium mucronatum TaxID=133383 RepID=A0A1R0GQJ6_9FUNG|nr:putative nudix hydrolase 7 [Smittium mucronatum]
MAKSAHVFPGGKLDDLDRDPEWKRYFSSPENEQDYSELDSLKVCAIREMYEETGFLAVSQNIEPEKAASFRANSEGKRTEEMMLLQTDELVQLDLKTPQEFLTQFKQGEISLYPPQFYQMTQMSKFFKWEDLAKNFMANSISVDSVPMQPFFVKSKSPKVSILTLPGDYMYMKKQNVDAVDIKDIQPPPPLHRMYAEGKFGKLTSIEIVENIGAIKESPLEVPKSKM